MKDYFDKNPHGFETHVEKEHNLAHYLFFLQYLIEKDENDYTGQETLVGNQNILVFTDELVLYSPLPRCGICIKTEPGTSSLRATASGNNMKRI